LNTYRSTDLEARDVRREEGANQGQHMLVVVAATSQWNTNVNSDPGLSRPDDDSCPTELNRRSQRTTTAKSLTTARKARGFA
jgi:hypothetical protein